MTCTVTRHTEGPDAGKLKTMIFSCDHEGCDVQPDDKEVIAHGGMRNMGWYAAGGRHFCPQHAKEAREQDERTRT